MSERISPLRQRMIEDMTIRNLSPATQRSYIHAVKRYSLYFGRSPDLLGLDMSGRIRCILSRGHRLGDVEPGRVRLALFLRRNACARRSPRAHSLCPPAGKHCRRF